jgi:hypothetical protein
LPVEVECREGRPLWVRFRGKRPVVRLLDAWRVGGRWWLGEGGRDYFLLEVAGELVLEVFREGERWVLSQVLD